MQSDGTYTRRVCAVLLADVTGYSALMGQDDERAARAVQELHVRAQGVVAESGGRAEPVAGDALFATFESVVAAVTAALQLQARIAQEEFAGIRLQMRIGVHVGDVLVREGAAFGDAINIAARLQTLAKPGTVCISEGVYRHVHNRVDERFIDLGKQRLKNIGDPVHAYLIVPRDVAHQHRRGTSRAWQVVGAGGAAVLAGVIAVIAARSWHSRVAETPATARLRVADPGNIRTPAGAADHEPGWNPIADTGKQIAIGVMGFKLLGKEERDDWQREALRDGLNAQLSQLSGVKVYSKEFIDFLITRQGLTDVEAATKLGISKMLSGSIVRVGDGVRVETHVVDVASGVLESSYTTEGPGQNFSELQSKLALGLIAVLNLPVTTDERRTLLAKHNADADAMKMLLEAEGGGSGARPEPSSRAPRWEWLARAAAFAAPVWADDAADQVAIRDVIERYRHATEGRQIDTLAAVYTEFPAELQAAQRRYFDSVRDLKVTIDNIDVAIVGDEAVVSYTRTDDFTDARTGRPMHVSVRLTKMLRRQQGAWKVAAN